MSIPQEGTKGWRSDVHGTIYIWERSCYLPFCMSNNSCNLRDFLTYLQIYSNEVGLKSVVTNHPLSLQCSEHIQNELFRKDYCIHLNFCTHTLLQLHLEPCSSIWCSDWTQCLSPGSSLIIDKSLSTLFWLTVSMRREANTDVWLTVP